MNPRYSSSTAIPGIGNPVGTGRLSALIRGLRGALTAMRQRRETIAELRALSDRELADIGLSRGAILAAAQRVPANDPGTHRRAA